MNRSPDDIFAAQFWAWPDPALKRDAHGRVLFVNAAFLQLFGGTVEAWRGQIVQGWAAPQPGPTPSRFEIRTPAAEGHPEQVYDWLESCASDGTAFAIARNVTAFVTSAPAVAQPVDATPVHDPVQHQPAIATPDPVAAAQQPLQAPAQPQVQQEVQQQAQQQAQPLQAPAQPAVAEQQQPPTEPEIVPAPPLAAPPQAAPVQAAAEAEPVMQAPTATEAPSNVVEHPVTQPAPMTHAVQQEIVPAAATAQAGHATAPMAAAPMQAQIDQPERDFERRALPIENDEAVLGNNWRDAVIAKAVGGEEAEPSLLRNEDTPPAAPKGDAIRILLAEDNAINALLTRTLLEADGHTVETVEDGLLAVEAMKTQNYDMIFMDMRMPNMDGLEATRKIRSLPNVSKDLPIVALTANAFDDDRNACFDSGMNDFMTKPVSAEELSEMVVRWTSQDEQKLAS